MFVFVNYFFFISSLNALENVRLRPTIKRPKAPGSAEDSPVAEASNTGSISTSVATAAPITEPSTKTSSNDELNTAGSGRFANRFSMFEQQSASSSSGVTNSPVIKFPLKKTAHNENPQQTDTTPVNQNSNDEDNNETVHKHVSSVGLNKPTPPSKPPRPAFGAPNLNNANGNNKTEVNAPAALTVKLRPVAANYNSTTSTNNSTSNTTTAITLSNNNSTANVPSSSLSSTTNQIENKLLNKANNSDQEKRSSVREIVQMLSAEESKVNLLVLDLL